MTTYSDAAFSGRSIRLGKEEEACHCGVMRYHWRDQGDMCSQSGAGVYSTGDQVSATVQSSGGTWHTSHLNNSIATPTFNIPAESRICMYVGAALGSLKLQRFQNRNGLRRRRTVKNDNGQYIKIA
jgi:hypothetical protein